MNYRDWVDERRVALQRTHSAEQLITASNSRRDF